MKELDDFTVERLQAFIDKPLDNGFTREEQMALVRIALAAKAVQPLRVEIQMDDAGLMRRLDEMTKWRSPAEPILMPVFESNSPELPDGWKLVPIEPTESMVIDGFESAPDQFFSEEDEWNAYQEMSGCRQAAHRAKLCWAAMLAAAPKPEK